MFVAAFSPKSDHFLALVRHSQFLQFDELLAISTALVLSDVHAYEAKRRRPVKVCSKAQVKVQKSSAKIKDYQ